MFLTDLVVVFLFTVGLEFSMSRLVVMLPLMGKIGLPQVVGTTALVTLATWWYLGTLAQALFAGLDIRYGDCTRAYVIAISGPASTRRSVRVARELAPAAQIFVRTEYVSEVDELETLGADEVIPAEFETALTLFDRVLGMYDVPSQTIDGLVAKMRLENYGFLRAVPPPRPDGGPVSPPGRAPS